MATSVNTKCLDCSRLSQSEAIAQHGLGTKSGDQVWGPSLGTKIVCWNAKTCPRRRSHYRHRLENNAKQRGSYRAAKTAGQSVEVGEEIFIPVEAPPVALLYLFRENRQDAHLHAISVAVWQGNQKLAEVAHVHCLGMTNRGMSEYLWNVLTVVGNKFGITEFEPPIRMESMECPLAECPLKGSDHVIF